MPAGARSAVGSVLIDSEVPLPINAMIHAAKADDAVQRALIAKRNPVLGHRAVGSKAVQRARRAQGPAGQQRQARSRA
jgi:hypothetical protein